MRKVIIAFGLVLGTLALRAQQMPQYTQYMVNPYLYNPALAGSEDFIDIKAGYRQQWQGFENAPRTIYLSAHSAIKEHNLRSSKADHKAYPGVGGYVMMDETGPISNLRMNASFSYNIPISKGQWFGALHHQDGIRLTLGMSLGVNQYKIDGAKLINRNSNPILDTPINDPLLIGGDLTKMTPDASFGAWLYFGEQYYLGIAANQILDSEVDFDGLDPDNQREVIGSLQPHFSAVAGLKKEIGYDLYVMPSFMTKWVSGAPLAFDLNCRLDYQDHYYGGISYRYQDAVALMAGLVIGKQRNIEFAYSYDITTSDIGVYSNGSHEVTLGYRILPKIHTRNASSTWRR
jgi:type IX secretion system PorP/SprF family membrane protein